jgi:hypothetical protein
MGANAKLIDHVALVSSSLKLQNITSFLEKKISEDYAGGITNGKFVTLTPFKKNRPKSMKTPHTNAKKI